MEFALDQAFLLKRQWTLLWFSTFARGLQPEGEVQRSSKPSASAASDVSGGVTVGDEPVPSLVNESRNLKTLAIRYDILWHCRYNWLRDLI